jgi:hypothetical protein
MQDDRPHRAFRRLIVDRAAFSRAPVIGAVFRARCRQLACRSSILLALHELDRSARHDRGNGVFIDKLRVAVPAKKDTEIIEPSYDPLKLDAVHEKDGQRRLIFSDMVEKSVLEAWCSIGGHVFSVFVVCRGLSRSAFGDDFRHHSDDKRHFCHFLPVLVT